MERDEQSKRDTMRAMHKTLATALGGLLMWGGVTAAPAPAPNPLSGKSVGELGKILGSSASEMERAHAAGALGEMVAPPEKPKGKRGGKVPDWEPQIPDGFIDACTTGLADPSGAVRFYSGQAMARAGVEALPALVMAAQSGNDATRISAIHAIGMMARTTGDGRKGASDTDPAPVFGSAVPVLRDALEDDNYIVREVACATFSRLGVAGAPALDELIACLEDDEFCVVNRAVHAVAAADPGGTRSVSALVKTLGSQHDVREFIVKELGRMGPAAKDAVPALCALAGEDKNSWQVALESAKALLGIVTYDEEPVRDAVAAERRQALRAIGEALVNQEAKFLQARVRNAVLDHRGWCPVGAEAEPLVEWFEQALREYSRTEKGHFGPPLPAVVGFLAGVGRQYKTGHLVALAGELKAAPDTREAWRTEFEPILKLENK